MHRLLNHAKPVDLGYTELDRSITGTVHSIGLKGTLTVQEGLRERERTQSPHQNIFADFKLELANCLPNFGDP